MITEKTENAENIYEGENPSVGANKVETEKEQKQRENAMKKYNANNVDDVLMNPYGEESEYLESAKKVKFADPNTKYDPEKMQKLRNERLDFMMKYLNIEETQNHNIVTAEDIYNTRYGDLFFKDNIKFDPYNMPEGLDELRYKLHKDENFKKSIKMFGKNAVEGFIASVKSCQIWKGFTEALGTFDTEIDNTGSIMDVIENGYSGIVFKPGEEKSRTTKEYWMNQFASLGTSVGMGAEMLMEGLLFKIVTNKTKLGRAITNSINVGKYGRNASKAQEVIREGNRASVLAREGRYAESSNVLRNSRINPNTIYDEISTQSTISTISGIGIGVRNATLNYQFNYNETYNESLKYGASDEEAKRIARDHAFNAFKVEIVASSALNVLQSSLINSINRTKFDSFNDMMISAISGQKVISDLPELSTKGIFWKNAGKFIGSVAMEGFEEVMEDGIAMIAKEKTYKNDYDRWKALGMSYSASDHYDELFDSFIGGVLGGTVFSSVRTAIGAIQGRTETQLQKKQVEIYNELKTNFKKSIDSSTYGIIKANKYIAELQEKFDNKLAIKIDGKEYKAKNSDGTENIEYAKAFETEKEKIKGKANKQIRMLQSIYNAGTAAKMISIMGNDYVCNSIVQNIQILNDKREAIGKILSNQDILDNAFEEYKKVNEIRNEIEKLDKEGKKEEADIKRKELSEFISNMKYSDMVENMNTVEELFINKESGNYDFNILNDEKEIIDAQIAVTDIFNHSFYRYYGMLNNDMDAAIQYASNEANIVVSCVGLDNTIDSILSNMKNVFDEIEKEHKEYFGSGIDKENIRLNKIAFTYNFFKSINVNGNYDFILDVIDKTINIKNGRDMDSKRTDNDKFEYLLQQYNPYFFKYFDEFIRMSSLRDSVSLFQSIFSKDEGVYSGIKDIITKKEYDALFDAMSQGNYKRMIIICESILKNRNSNVPKEQLFSEFIKENEKYIDNSKKRIAEIENEIKEIENTNLESLLEKIPGYNKNDLSNDKITNAQSSDEKKDIEEKIRIKDIVKKAIEGNEEIKSMLKKDFNYELSRLKSEIEKTYQYNDLKIKDESDHRYISDRISLLKEEKDIDDETSDALYSEAVQKAYEIVNSYLNFNKPISKKIIYILPELSEEFKKEIYSRLEKFDIFNTIYNGSEDFTEEEKKASNEALIDIALKYLEIEIEKHKEAEKKIEEEKQEYQKQYDILNNEYKEYSEAQKIYSEINEKKKELEKTKSDIESEKKILEESLPYAEKGYSMKWEDNKPLLELVLERKKKNKEITSENNNNTYSTPIENVKNKAFKTISEYEKFFDTNDNKSAHMLAKIRNEANYARQKIEMTKNINKFNRSLETKKGIISFNLRKKYLEVIKMPSSTIKEARKKKRKLRIILEEFYLNRKIMSSKIANEVWESSGKEILYAYEDLEKKIVEMEKKNAMSIEEREREEKRQKEEMIFNKLNSVLDEKQLKNLADTELSDYRAVIDRINELVKQGKIEAYKGGECIRIIESERRESILNERIDGIVSEMKKEDDEDKNNVFDLTNVKKNTIYYIGEKNKKKAKNLFGSQTSSIIENIIEVTDRTFFDLSNESVIIHVDNDGNIHYYDDEKREIISLPSEEETQDTSIVPEEQKSENRIKQEEQKEPKDFLSESFGFASESVSYVDSNGETQETTLVNNIIQCIIEAAQDPILSLCFDYRNIVSERTNNIPLIDYIVENGKINESEASYIISAISDIINYGITEETFFSEILYASGEKRYFWPLVVDYAVSMGFCSNRLDFANKFREYKDKYNVPNACIGQRSAPVNIQSVGYSITPNAQTKKEEGRKNSKNIDVEENNKRYRGNTGLVIRNGFKYDENIGVVTPTVVFENGDSVISKEGLAAIESMGEISRGKVTVSSGMHQIIRDNINIKENGINGIKDTFFIHRIKEEVGEIKLDIIKKNIEEGKEWNLNLNEQDEIQIIELAKKYAYIFFRKEGNIIGFLPEYNAWNEKTVYIEPERVMDSKNGNIETSEQFTDSALQKAKNKTKALEESLENYRNSVCEGNNETTINISLNPNNDSGKLVSVSEAKKDGNDIEYGDTFATKDSNKKSGNATFVMDEKTYMYHYNDKENPNRKSSCVLPGYQNIDERTGVISRISNGNKDQNGFRLSQTANPVFVDMKIRLQKTFVNIIKYAASLEDKKLFTDICNSNELAEIIKSLGINSVEDFLMNLEKKVKDKPINFSNIFDELKDNIIINNSKSVSASSGNNDNEVGIFMFGSNKSTSSPLYYDNYTSGDCIFYLGKKEDKDKKKLVLEEKDLTLDKVIRLAEMTVGQNVDSMLDNLTISYNIKGIGYGSADENSLFRKRLYSRYNILNDTTEETTKSLKDVIDENARLPIGTFSINLGKDTNGNEIVYDMKYKGFNIEFGSSVKVREDISEQKPSTSTLSVNEQKNTFVNEDITEELINGPGNLTKVEDLESKLTDEDIRSQDSSVTFEQEEKIESVSFEDEISSWLPEMREIDEFSKGLLRRIISMCEKDGKKIQDITTSDISEKIIEYINKRKQIFNDRYKPFLYSSLILKYGKDYSLSNTIIDKILDEYSFLNREDLLQEAEIYVSDKENYKEKEINGKKGSIGDFNSALANAKLISDNFIEYMFDVENGMFQSYISDYLDRNSLYVLEDQDVLEYNSSEADEDETRGSWWYNEDNTTPLFSVLSMEMKLFFATIPTVKIDESSGNISIEEDGRIKCDLCTATQGFCKGIAMAGCYDLGTILNFIVEIGKQNTKYTGDSLIERCKEIASSKNQWTELANSLYERLMIISKNNPLLFSMINYKLNNLEAANFVYVDEHFGDKHRLKVELSSKNKSVSGIIRMIEKNAQDIISSGKIINPVDNKTCMIVENNKYTHTQSLIIYQVIDKIKEIEKKNETEILSDESINLIINTLYQFTGWRFAEDTIRNNFTKTNIQNKLGNLKQTPGSDCIIDNEIPNGNTKQNNKTIIYKVVSYLVHNKIFWIKELVKEDMKYNFIPESRAIKTGGKNVQAWTQRTMATARLMELREKEAEKVSRVKELEETVFGKDKTNDPEEEKKAREELSKIIMWPQSKGFGLTNRGLMDITVYRTTGRTSERITELDFLDNIYIRTQLFCGSSRFANYSYTGYDLNGNSIVNSYMYLRRVSDFTDSNKTKSGYWEIPCIGATESYETILRYMVSSLFFNELRRIANVSKEGARSGERIIQTIPSYNLIKIKDKNGIEVTLAKYLSDGDIDEKIEYLKNSEIQRDLIIEAENESYKVLRSYVKDLCGVDIKNEKDTTADNINNSLWGKCGLISADDLKGKGKLVVIGDLGGDYGLNGSYNTEVLRKNNDARNTPQNFEDVVKSAMNFAVNDIVTKFFLANKMYSSSFEITKSVYKDINTETEEELKKGLLKAMNKLESGMYKRMAGILTGGQKLDYSRVYKDDDGNYVEGYEDWGGNEHSEFLYLSCEETSGRITTNLDYYLNLYFGDNENVKGEIEKWLQDPEGNRKKIEKVCPMLMSYLNIDSTDGQEFCTWREALDTMKSKGAIDHNEWIALVKVYSKLDKGEKLNEKEQELSRRSLQVFKMVYCGVSNVTNSSESMDYVKSSVCPLLPQYTFGNPKLEGIRKAMTAVEEKTHRNVHFTFRSAIKTGGNIQGKSLNFDTISGLMEDKSLTYNEKIDKLIGATFIGHRKYLSIQNETDTKIHTKKEKKNKNKKVLVRNSESTKMKSQKNTFNAGYIIDKIANDLGVNLKENGTIENIAEFFARKVKNKNNSERLKKRIILLLKNTEIENFASVFNKFLYDCNMLQIDENDLKKIINILRNRQIVQLAYEKVVEEAILTGNKEEDYKKHIEKIKEIVNKTEEEKNKLLSEYKKTYLYEKDVNEYTSSFKKSYDEISEKVEEFINDYMNIVENIELSTVELTQFQHLATSGGIATRRDEIFDIDLDNIFENINNSTNRLWEYIISTDDEKHTIRNLFQENVKGKWVFKRKISGIALEKLRSAFEIVNITDDVLDYLYYDLRIITQEQYNFGIQNHTIPSMQGIINSRENVSRIKEVIINELKQRGGNNNAIDLLNANVSLFMNPDVTKIENLLMSMVRKRASKSYMNGTSFFLATPHEFKQTKENTKLKVKSDSKILETNGILWLDRNREPGKLRAMKVSQETVTDKNGNKKKTDVLQMAECAIASQFTFFNGKEYVQVNFKETYIKNGKKVYKYLCDKLGNEIGVDYDGDVFLNEKMCDPKLFEMVSLRVPTSGLMNTCALKIVAFLPESMGSTIILPEEHIAQFGEDFDIDKRFCYMSGYHIDSDGKINRVTAQTINDYKAKYGMLQGNREYKELIRSLEYSLKSNNKLDMYMSVMKCTDKSVQKQLNLTLEWNDLTNTRDVIVLFENKNTEDLYRLSHSMPRQAELCVKSSSSLKGTGVWADCGTYNAILNKVSVFDGDKHHGVLIKRDGKRLNIRIDDCGSEDGHLAFFGDLSNSMTIKHKTDEDSTKIQVISAELNANLDSVKEDITPHTNENRATYQFFTMMALMGFNRTGLIDLCDVEKDGKLNLRSKTGKKVRLDLKSMIAVQPVIKELTEIELHRNSSINKQYISSNDIILKMLERLGFTQTEINNFKKGQGEGLLSMYSLTENGVLERKEKDEKNEKNKECYTLDYGKDIQSDFLYIEASRSLDEIDRSNKDIENFMRRQLAVLSFFTTVRNLGNQMQKYKSLFTVSSKGVGSLYLDVYDKIEALNSIMKSPFENLSTAIGHFIEKKKVKECPEGYYDIYGLDYYIKPTTIEGNTILVSLQTANSILGNAMRYMEPGLKNIIDSLRDTYRRNEIFQNKRKKLDRRMVNDLSSFVLLHAAATCNGEGIFKKYPEQNLGEVIQLERIRLIQTEREEFERAKLSEEEKILSSIIKANPRKRYNENDEFIKTLNMLRKNHPIYSNTPLFNAIEKENDGTFAFIIDDNNPYMSRQIQNQLIDMFSKPQQLSKNYSTRDFVKDFIAMSIVMDDKQGMNNFRSIIPVKILEELGMIDAMKKTIKEIETDISLSNRFIEQFYINNSVDVLKTINETEMSNNTISINNEKIVDLGYTYNDGNGNKPLDMFRYNNGKFEYVAICNPQKSTAENTVYDTYDIKNRYVTGKNYYNPFYTLEESAKKTISMTSSLQNQIIKNTISIIENKNDKETSDAAFNRIASYLSKGHNDPMLVFLKNALSNNKLGNIVLKLKNSQEGKFASAVEISLENGIANYSIMFNSRNMRKLTQTSDQVMHEEIMHLLLTSYLGENAKVSDGKIILKNGSNDKLSKTLEHYYELKKFYNERPDLHNKELNHVFDNGDEIRGFNEFIAYIMSAHTEMTNLISLKEGTQGGNKKGLLYEILDTIIDFFKYLCELSGVHKDVVGEVKQILYDLYCNNDINNIDTDILAVIERYGTEMEYINGTDGAIIVKGIDEYQPKGKSNSVYVTEYVNQGQVFPPSKDMFELGFERKDVGTFIDRALRIAFDTSKSDEQIRAELYRLENPNTEDFKKYNGVPILNFDKKTIDNIIKIASEIKFNGGIQKIYNEEISLGSGFKVMYNGELKHLSGKPDIIIVDKSGKVHIIDIKTMMRKNPDKLKNDKNEYVSGILDTSEQNYRLDSYSKQILCYKLMLQEISGIIPENVSCHIFELDYNVTNDTKNKGKKKVDDIGITVFSIDNFVSERYGISRRYDENMVPYTEISTNDIEFNETVKRIVPTTDLSKTFCK